MEFILGFIFILLGVLGMHLISNGGHIRLPTQPFKSGVYTLIHPGIFADIIFSFVAIFMMWQIRLLTISNYAFETFISGILGSIVSFLLMISTRNMPQFRPPDEKNKLKNAFDELAKAKEIFRA